MKKCLFFLCLTILGCASDCYAPPVAVPEASEKALAFYQNGNIVWMIAKLWSLLVPAAFVFMGWGAKLRTFCTRISEKWIWHTLLFSLFFLLIIALLNLPLGFYADYLRLHHYGLSNQTFMRWLSHSFISIGVSTLTGVVLALLVYWVIRKSPKRWWLYFGLLNLSLAIFLIFVQPIWVAPLFNHFGPMKDKELEHKIVHLAERAGIKGSRVFEVDMSADTKQMNAYVTGMGSSKRIVIWDTTIQSLSEEELLFVVGHEAGHYVLHHLWWGVLAYTALSIITLFLVHITATFFLRRFSERMGFGVLRDVASFPLLLLLYTFYSLLLSPVTNFFTRTLEHNADTFGLELTHSNRAAAMSFIKFTDINLSNPWPGPLYVLFRGSHPSIGKRITYFNEYKPWCQGKPSKYGKFLQSDSNLDQ